MHHIYASYHAHPAPYVIGARFISPSVYTPVLHTPIAPTVLRAPADREKHINGNIDAPIVLFPHHNGVARERFSARRIGFLWLNLSPFLHLLMSHSACAPCWISRCIMPMRDCASCLCIRLARSAVVPVVRPIVVALPSILSRAME